MSAESWSRSGLDGRYMLALPRGRSDEPCIPQGLQVIGHQRLTEPVDPLEVLPIRRRPSRPGYERAVRLVMADPTVAILVSISIIQTGITTWRGKHC